MLLPLLWAACAIAAYLYSVQQNIPIRTALAVLPAFLLEATFFYALAVDRVRSRIEKIPSAGFALALTLSALAPYSAATLALGTFRWHTFLWIALLAGAVSFWYILFHQPASDLLFLIFMAVVWLSRILHQFYADPHPKLQLEVLGQLMWFRTGIFAMVGIRRPPNVGFGFWPQKREWMIGTVYYAVFLPVAAALAWWIRFAKPRWPPSGWEKTSFMAIATFFGVLWVLALGEEFFFRGLLQQWMSKWLGNDWLGLLAASLVFGSAHLWFGHAFPNWRMAAMGTLLGICCGLAFRQARSIRASMVTHALVVTTWRVFFY